jgi:hypothetical protein
MGLTFKLGTAPQVTTNYIPKSNSNSFSNSLIYDNGSNTAIGGTTITDGNLLNIIGNQSSVNVGLVLNNTNGTYPKIYGIQNVNSNLVFYDYSANATRLTIASTGAATFSSSVTAGCFLTNGASGTAGQEAIRINNNNGYIGLFDGANTTRTGYLQANTSSDVQLMTSQSIPLVFGTANTERMRITSQGQVLINTSTASRAGLLEMSGSSVQYNLLSITDTGVAQAGVYYIAFWNSSGNLAGGVQHPTNSTVSYYTGPSDQRLKSNIKDVEESVLPLFDDVKLKTYNHIADEDESIVYKGFLAQEMVDRFPEAYGLDKEGYYTFNPNGYIPYLVKAIQELSAKVSALEAK